ncbi:hypothetical protein P5673_012817 [Acropora cervicornis]|uniref:Uncharacterized protein n=1 Tax=Acropora cervicornis TaxID=6130 RepID=A0AAD9QM70_ACRCE|nr:hypothetical protein P5673_012817 [Acropora cervicornis]
MEEMLVAVGNSCTHCEAKEFRRSLAVTSGKSNKVSKIADGAKLVPLFLLLLPPPPPPPLLHLHPQAYSEQKTAWPCLEQDLMAWIMEKQNNRLGILPATVRLKCIGNF